MQMTARFTLGFEDLIAFQKDIINNSHTHHIKKKYFQWITSIIIFLAALFLMKSITLLTFVTSLCITIVYFLIFPLLYNNLSLAKLKNQLQKSDYSHVLGVCNVTISEEGISREVNDSTSHFEWYQFERVNEDDRHYFLYVSDLQGLIISKTPDNMNDEKTSAYNDLIKTYTHANKN